MVTDKFAEAISLFFNFLIFVPRLQDLRERKSYFSKGLEVIFEVEKAPAQVDFNVKSNIREVFARNVPYQHKEGAKHLTIKEIMNGPFSYMRGKDEPLVVHADKEKGWCLSVCLSVCLPICLFVCLPICLFVCLPICLSVCLFVTLNFFYFSFFRLQKIKQKT